MENNFDPNDKAVRLQRLSHAKLGGMASRMKVTKKRLAEMLISIGSKLFDRTKGHLGLFLDDRLKIKLYFDEDERTEIDF